ncbi:MAG: carbonic anhydrase [Pirellulales bacterium]|nr:carbonic anhydrase [Pirellulales bacterium]
MFQRLRAGQNPRVFFITCSDSRIDPSLITQTEPGELFVLRNPGNIIPPFGTAHGSEAATVEYAVAGLKVPHIIVCGHYHCGAMTELVQREHVDDLPITSAWLGFAQPVRNALGEYRLDSNDDLVSKACELNVLIQMQNLRTHPSVADRLAQNDISIHGWIYDFLTADVQVYHSGQHCFISLT